MRLYTFTNMYTSGIHAGIQTAHLVHELFTEYSEDRERSFRAQEVLYDWAEDHKTIIVLNGGYHSNLESIYEELCRLAPTLRLPFAKFHESKEALNGALTCVGIVVPQSIYELPEAAPLFGGLPEPYSNERKLKNLLDSMSLAR